QAAHVGAVRSRFAAEARGIGGIAQRQLPSVEDRAAIEVGERHLRGRDQEQVPVAGDLEQVLLELRQVAGAAQRIGVDQEGRLDLRVAVLARVQLQHEVDERAREPRARPHQHREARARHARGALEVENAQSRTDLPVRLRLEVERARLAVPPHLAVVFGGFPDRHRGVRQVRHGHQQVGELLIHLAQLRLELLDLLATGLVGGKDRRRIEPLLLGARDLLARRVLLALEVLDARNQLAALRIERGEGREDGVGIEAAVAETRARLVEVRSHVCGIEHPKILYRLAAALSYDPDDMSEAKTTVRKAVFPAAGLGTRFLPATKAQPKEMLPLVDKPIIQYGVEEAVASGVRDIILVTGRGKNAIEDHFDVSIELESFLEARGKTEQLAEIRQSSNLMDLCYVRQGEPLGLGHAVLVTRALVGDEPFAVILGDDVIDASPPALRQMIDVFEEMGGPVLAIEEVPHETVSSYGVIDAEEVRPGVYRIRDMVEKPPRDEAPSNLAIIGRYVLTPDIFPALEETAKEKDRTGEIQLTNGLRRLLKKRLIYGCKIDGVRHDTGNKLGFLKAVVYFALRRPDLAEPFREYLRGVDLQAVRQDSGQAGVRR